MEQKEILFQKKREIGEVISDSFTFLKQNSTQIIRIICIYVLPFLIIYAAAQLYFQKNILSRIDFSNQEALQENIKPFFLNYLLIAIFSVFIKSLLTGTFYSYIEAYIKKGKGNFSISDISNNLFTNSLLAFGANLIYLIIVIFGITCCILPGIFLANTLSLIVFISIFEKKGINEALWRSWNLVNPNWGNTFLLNIIGIIIVVGTSFLLSLPLSFVGTPDSSLVTNPQALANLPIWYWIVSGIIAVISNALYVIIFTFQAFQYFNLAESEKPKITLQ
jgi:hypothetical protein